jgi:hypothetical protein
MMESHVFLGHYSEGMGFADLRDYEITTLMITFSLQPRLADDHNGLEVVQGFNKVIRISK